MASVGRPTRVEAEQIANRIIDAASHLFSEHGFEATSIDLVATRAQISKRTFYSRFKSKEALFAAVVRKGSESTLSDLELVHAPDKPIEIILTEIAVALLRHAVSPRGAFVLNRMILGEAHRFPQLARAVYDNAIVRTQSHLAQIMANSMHHHGQAPEDPFYLAEQFMNAVVDGPARLMVLSGNIDETDVEIEAKVSRAVRLFFDGARSTWHNPLPSRIAVE